MLIYRNYAFHYIVLHICIIYIRPCSGGYCRVELSQFEGVGLDGQDDCLRVTIAIAGTLVVHSVSLGFILSSCRVLGART